MKRTPVFFTLAIFVFAMTLGLASAVTITGIPSQLSQEGSSFNITITSASNETVSLSIADVFDVDNNEIYFENIADVVLNDSNDRTEEVTISYTVQSGFIFRFGESYSTTITANGTETGTSYEILNFEETGFCSGIDNRARILLNIEDIQVISGFGDDDDYWYLMDEIEVEVEIEPANYDIEDVEIEWELYNTNGKKIDSGDVSVSDLEENEDEIITFTFKLDSKIKDFDGQNAILYIRAVGYIDDSDSIIYDGEKSCAWDKKQVSVNTKESFVIVDELKINGISTDFDDYNIVSCGQEITLTGKAWNIGNKDQDDVLIDFYSNALGVDNAITFSEIDSYDSETFSFNFEFPENMDAGIYSLTIEVYDEDNDIYENKEDDESRFTVLFKLEDSCKFVEPTINANLVGEAYSGKEIVVTTYLRNNNDRESNFIINAEGYESWATLSNIEPKIITLKSGEATEVALTFVAKKDSIGEYNFDINVLVDGKETISQPASINVEKSGFDIKDYLTKSNLQIAGIVLLNLILLIAIIVVARKIVKKK